MPVKDTQTRFRISRLIQCLAVLAWLLLAGCGARPAPLPTETPTPVPATETPTPTVVWFPPTPTFTPFPSPTLAPPTPEQRPGIGGLLLEDDFSETAAWQVIALEGGSARLGKDEITIVINKQRMYVSSLRAEPQLADFYAEITASLNFCRGADEYGLILRAASAMDYYRFGITCDGQTRLDRIYRGQASSPQPPLLSGSVPLGAPSSARLGVWAVGSEMRFFINEEYQFSILDGTIPAGTLGVFARSASDEPLTVNFSALSIWEVNPEP